MRSKWANNYKIQGALYGIFILIILVFLTLLAGCSLAQEEVSKEKFIGFYVTTEELDLTDWENTTNDMTEDNLWQTDSRLYATRVEDKSGDIEYVFPGTTGIACFVITNPQNNEASNYTDPGISNFESGVHVSDDENTTTMTGTVYVTPTNNMDAFYCNPIYEDADGRIYVTTSD
ncbi:MAG: hypothetical protein LBN22_11655, partial [Clostridiales Family XIII bacterium]|nr:hypothetical protein [Clostridiales Family XIII bacterium]